MLRSAKNICVLLIFLTVPAVMHAQYKANDAVWENKKYLATEEQLRFRSSLLRQSLADYDVLHYHINLFLDPPNKAMNGSVQIELVPVVTIETSILFDFAGLRLDSVFIGSKKVTFNRESEQLSVFTPSIIVAGDTQMVTLYYQGKPLKGLYFRQNSHNETIVYSHNEPYDAHFWFPCKDDPGDKATSSMTITVPAPMVVLSNGTLSSQSAGPGHTLFAWHEKYPIATYLISIVAGNYQITTNQFNWGARTLPLAYWVYPSDLDRGAEALLWTKEMLGFFSEFIGDYPFLLEKYDMSEVPLQEAAAMEHQTATTMGDFVMDHEGIIAHELAHQWWGDALTPQTFVDIWLNEGFASYFDALFTEYKYGKKSYQQQMDIYKSKMNTDGSLPYPIYNPPERYLFGSSVYLKGAWVLHMLRYEVGDTLFKNIIRDYYAEYNYANVITENLRRVTEKITGRSFLKFFDQWLNYGGMPLIIGDWQQSDDRVSITLDQQQQDPVYNFNMEILVQGTSDDTLIIIPVKERISQQDIYFTEKVVEIVIDPEDKILNSNNSPLYYIPEKSKLLSTFPNPSRDKISIIYQVSKKEHIEILIFDVLGQLVTTLVDKSLMLGVYQVDWFGSAFPSGSYYCTMKTSDNLETMKITLVK